MTINLPRLSALYTILGIGAITALTLSGCQQITEVEFYPPSKEIEAYCTKATKDTPGRGPIKSIKGKSGSPDFSDSKSFSFSLLNL